VALIPGGEFEEADFQRSHELEHYSEREVDIPALAPADVVTVQARAEPEFLLGEPTLLA
jgi:hypothetical protein